MSNNHALLMFVDSVSGCFCSCDWFVVTLAARLHWFSSGSVHRPNKSDILSPGHVTKWQVFWDTKAAAFSRGASPGPPRKTPRSINMFCKRQHPTSHPPHPPTTLIKQEPQKPVKHTFGDPPVGFIIHRCYLVIKHH